MVIECLKCDQFHDVAPTGMVLIIQAFQNGEMQKLTKDGLTSLCLMDAFTEDNIKDIKRKYPKGQLYGNIVAQ